MFWTGYPYPPHHPVPSVHRQTRLFLDLLLGAEKNTVLQLWQRYGFERVMRDEKELAFTIGYVVANPVRAGLVDDPSEYTHLGSQRYTVHELLKICEYSNSWV